MELRSQRRALVVDDERGVRELLGEMLNATGTQCDVVASGQEALAAVAQNTYDVIVTDYKMPGMSGVEMAETLRDMKHDVPIVVVTGSVTPVVDDIRKRGLLVLEKPFSIDLLSAAVEQALTPRGPATR